MKNKFFIILLLFVQYNLLSMEETPTTFKKLNKKEQDNYDSIITLMTYHQNSYYFFRSLPKEVRDKIKNENIYHKNPQINSNVRNVIIHEFQSFMSLPIEESTKFLDTSFGDIYLAVNQDYIENGFQGQTPKEDFYQILFSLFDNEYRVEILKKYYDYSREEKLECFLIDLLLVAPVAPESKSGSGIDYKEQYKNFAQQTDWRRERFEGNHKSVIILISTLGVKALFKKLVIDCLKPGEDQLDEILITEFQDMMKMIQDNSLINEALKAKINSYLNSGTTFLENILEDKIFPSSRLQQLKEIT